MKAYLRNNEYEVEMPPPESRWSRPPVLESETNRVFYATSSGGVFYFRTLTEEQKERWDTANRHLYVNEEEIANELRSTEGCVRTESTR